MRPQGTYGGAWLDGGSTPLTLAPRRPQGTFGGAWLQGGSSVRPYLPFREDMPPEVAAALDAYPERTTRLGLGDDGQGCGNGDAEGLGSIFSKIGKAIGKAAKGVAKGVGTVAKGVAKGVKTVATKVIAPAAVFAAKNVGKVAPIVGLVPGFGTVAAGIVGGAGKLVSGVANKKKFGKIVADVAIGGGTGAGLSVARKTVGGMLKRGKVAPEQQEYAEAVKVEAQGRKREAARVERVDRAAQKAAQKKAVAARKVQEANAKQAEVLVKGDKRSKLVADMAVSEAKQALKEAGQAVEQVAQQSISAGVAAASGGGGGGGSPFAPTPPVGEDGAAPVVEAGLFGGISPVLLLAGGVALFLAFGNKRGR